jgi:hypothetical protein
MARPSGDGLRERCPWCERELPARRTFAVECAKCRETKWPSLLERPEPGTWVCALCIASGHRPLSESRRAALQQGAAAWRATRNPASSKSPTSGKAPSGSRQGGDSPLADAPP